MMFLFTSMKQHNWFYIRKSDRKALLFLLCLALLLVSVLLLTGNDAPNTQVTTADTTGAASRSYNAARKVRHKPQPYLTEDGRQAVLFDFDPNTADSAQLLKLGLQPWQVKAIYKYRAKGGIYHTPHDFGRLYGMTRKQYRELEPYIHISDDYLPASTLFASRSEEAKAQYERYKASDAYVPYKEFDRDTIRYPIKLKPGEHISLSTADTTMLKKVPGIGSGWAKAIVGYRQRLGGFYAVSQLREVDGFPEEALIYFDVDPSTIKKLNINRLSINQLRKHPYINFYQARAIQDYRRLHGDITNLDQLRLLSDFPPEAIARLRHYVTY